MKIFNNSQKIAIVKAYHSGKSVSEICKEQEIKRERVYAWINKYTVSDIIGNIVKETYKSVKRPRKYAITGKSEITTKMVCYTLKKETELRFDEFAKINQVNKSAMVDKLINAEIDSIEKAKLAEINKTTFAEILVNLQILINKINL